jgi:hypothetical protein
MAGLFDSLRCWLPAGYQFRRATGTPLDRIFPATGWIKAFSSGVDAGSREENASKQESGASVLIQSEPIMR